MDFDAENKVIVETMNHDEAVAFVKFLQSEIVRHQKDIAQAVRLMITVGTKFDLEFLED